MTWEGKVTRDQAGHPNQGSLTREWSLNFHLEKLAATVLRYHPGPGISTIADSLEEVKLPELALQRTRTATPCLELGRRIPQLVALRGPLVLVSLPCLP